MSACVCVCVITESTEIGAGNYDVSLHMQYLPYQQYIHSQNEFAG